MQYTVTTIVSIYTTTKTRKKNLCPKTKAARNKYSKEQEGGNSQHLTVFVL
jgi:hypothetical protein